jgi:16S rRNA (guanine966-N2)-methyltransferase
MRIIAGIARGRRLRGPKGSVTRPPTDRMREAVFSSLGPRLEDAAVLDLFAGSGSFGLESLSRGARCAVFVERDPRAVKVLTINIDAVGLGGTIRRGNVLDVVSGLSGAFDLAFIDPPYAMSDDYLEQVLAATAAVMAVGATVLVHRRRDQEQPRARGTLVATGDRRYGDSRVWWYEKEER